MMHDDPENLVVLCLFFGENDLLSAGLKVFFQIFKELCIFGSYGVGDFGLHNPNLREVHQNNVFHRFWNDKRKSSVTHVMQGAVHFYGVGILLPLALLVIIIVFFLCYRPRFWKFRGQFLDGAAVFFLENERHGMVEHVNVRRQPVHIADDREDATAFWFWTWLCRFFCAYPQKFIKRFLLFAHFHVFFLFLG